MPKREPEFLNSAGRLLALLESISSSGQMIDTLPALLGPVPQDQISKQQATLLALMELHNTYTEFRSDMENANVSEEQRTAMLSGLLSIKDCLYPTNLLSGFRSITEAERSLLKVCASFIDQESQLTDSDIETIRQSISTLRSHVEHGEISPTLRKVLLELIRLSEDAISRFHIHGARGLKRAFKSMLADAAELYGVTDPNVDRKELVESTIWTNIVGHLKTLDEVASRLLKYRPLLEGASKILIATTTSSELEPANEGDALAGIGE